MRLNLPVFKYGHCTVMFLQRTQSGEAGEGRVTLWRRSVINTTSLGDQGQLQH